MKEFEKMDYILVHLFTRRLGENETAQISNSITYIPSEKVDSQAPLPRDALDAMRTSLSVFFTLFFHSR